jgi:hypothetical protein
MKIQPLTDDDNWLRISLQGTLGAASVPTPDPNAARYHLARMQWGRRPGRSRGKLMGALIAASMVMTIGAVGAFAATGSADPAAWTAAASSAVSSCKAALDAGDHSIGACVSAAAKSKGQQDPAKGASDKFNGNGLGHSAATPGHPTPGHATPGHATPAPARSPRQGGGPATPPSSHGAVPNPHAGDHPSKP